MNTINTIISNGLIKYMEKMPEKPFLTGIHTLPHHCSLCEEYWAEYESSLKSAIQSAPSFENQDDLIRLMTEQGIECWENTNEHGIRGELKLKSGHFSISVDREVQVVKQRIIKDIQFDDWIDDSNDFSTNHAQAYSEGNLVYRFIARLVEEKENSAHSFTEGCEIKPTEEKPERSDNELIASFMDAKPFQSNPQSGICWVYEIEKPQGSMYWHESNMQYSTSWDWLMPVVEKIESLGDYYVDMRTTACFVKRSFDDCIISEAYSGTGSRIKYTYKAVVEFIKWYNTQPK